MNISRRYLIFTKIKRFIYEMFRKEGIMVDFSLKII